MHSACFPAKYPAFQAHQALWKRQRRSTSTESHTSAAFLLLASPTHLIYCTSLPTTRRLVWGWSETVSPCVSLNCLETQRRVSAACGGFSNRPLALLFAAGRHVDFRGAEAHYAADKTRLKVETSRERMLSALIPELWLPISCWFIKVFGGVRSRLWVVFSRCKKNWREKSKLITRELRKIGELLDSETTLLSSILTECGGKKCITDDWSITLCSVARWSVSLSASFTPVLLDRWTWKQKKKMHFMVWILLVWIQALTCGNKSDIKPDIG